MLKIFFNAKCFSAFVLLCFLPVLLVYAQPKAFSENFEYNFGTRFNTEKVESIFLLENRGTSPLVLQNIKGDCSCIAVKSDKIIIMPNETSKIYAVFDLVGRAGKTTGKIFINTNDPEKGTLIFFLYGEALSAVSILPDILFFNNILTNTVIKREFTIRFKEEGHNVLNIKSPFNWLDITIDKLNGKEIRVILSGKAPDKPSIISDNLVIDTDYPKYTNIKLPIKGRIVGKIYCIPDSIDIKMMKDAERKSFSFLVFSANKEPFKITSISMHGNNLHYTVRKSIGGTGYIVAVSNLYLKDAENNNAIRIFSDITGEEIIELPLVRLTERGKK